MSARDFSQADWRLKLRRAEHHFQELKANVRAYGRRHPYEARREREGQGDPNIWSYRLRITEQPGPEIALPMGDVVHNIRAALDYLATALIPPGGNYTTFPILIDDKTRQRFEALKGMGMDRKAVAIIEELQPRIVDTPQLHPLSILGRLDNLDKHQNLVPVVVALRDAASKAEHPTLGSQGWDLDLCFEGTEVAKFGFPGITQPPESEVKVNVLGTPKITVDIGLQDGYGEVMPALETLLSNIPIEIFDALEPFVRR